MATVTAHQTEVTHNRLLEIAGFIANKEVEITRPLKIKMVNDDLDTFEVRLTYRWLKNETAAEAA